MQSASFPIATLFLTVILASGGCRPDDGSTTAPPVPEAWDGMEPLVRQHIEQRLAEVDAAPREAATWAALGRAYHANDLIDLAAPCYERALSIAKADARCWYLLARVRSDLGEVDGALAAVDMVIAHDSTVSFAHWRRGFWLVDEGRLDEAEAAFSSALELQGQDPVAMVGLARVAAERGDHAGAAVVLQGVVSSFPGANGVYVRGLLGEAYRHSGREAEAQALIPQEPVTSVSWPDPWSDELYQDRRLSEWIVVQAHQMIQAGNPSGALQHLRQLAETYGDDPTVLKMIGQASFAIGDLDAAMNALRKVVEQDPDDFSANMNLAYAHERRHELTAALPYAAKAADLRPEIVPAQVQYARILIETGRPASAIAVLERVVSANPDVAIGYRHLAVAYADAGRHDEAAASLERYTTLAPGDPQLHAVRQQVEAARVISEPEG